MFAFALTAEDIASINALDTEARDGPDPEIVDIKLFTFQSLSSNERYIMRGAVLYGPRDVRFEERDAPKILKPADAVIRMSATCVCGSDLWPYRDPASAAQPTPMGHEYCGIVAEVGRDVRTVKPGQFVIGSFFASDNTCPHCMYISTADRLR